MRRARAPACAKACASEAARLPFLDHERHACAILSSVPCCCPHPTQAQHTVPPPKAPLNQLSSLLIGREACQVSTGAAQSPISEGDAAAAAARTAPAPQGATVGTPRSLHRTALAGLEAEAGPVGARIRRAANRRDSRVPVLQIARPLGNDEVPLPGPLAS